MLLYHYNNNHGEDSARVKAVEIKISLKDSLYHQLYVSGIPVIIGLAIPELQRRNKQKKLLRVPLILLYAVTEKLLFRNYQQSLQFYLNV